MTSTNTVILVFFFGYITGAFVSGVIKDFTPKRDAPQFRVGDTVYHAVLDIPALSAIEFSELARKFETAEGNEQRELVERMFRMILVPASAEIFIARLGDTENPIGVATMFAIIEWLMEEFGLRPTESSSSSSTQSETQESGESLMVTVPVTELTSK